MLSPNLWSVPNSLEDHHNLALVNECLVTQIAKFMGPKWGPRGSCRFQMAHVGPMNLALWATVMIPEQFSTIHLLVLDRRWIDENYCWLVHVFRHRFTFIEKEQLSFYLRCPFQAKGDLTLMVVLFYFSQESGLSIDTRYRQNGNLGDTV